MLHRGCTFHLVVFHLSQLYFYYTEPRECYEIVLHKSYFHSRKMDATATTSPQMPIQFSEVCNVSIVSRNKNFSPTPVRKNTVVKYAKLPEYDCNSKGKFFFIYFYVLQVFFVGPESLYIAVSIVTFWNVTYIISIIMVLTPTHYIFT